MSPQEWLIQNALIATAAAVLLAGVLRVWRPSPRWEHLLWVVLGVKFVLPPTVAIPAALPGVSVVARGMEGETLAGRPAAEGVVSVSESGPAARLGSAGVAAVRDEEAPVHPALVPRAIRLLSTLWLWSAALALCVRLVVYVRWRRARRPAPAPSDLLTLAEEVAREAGVAPPRVRVDATLAAPAITGPGRPCLLWPAGLVELPRERMRTIIAHELAHVRRGDLWLGIVELVIDSVWWWYPGWHGVRRRLRDAAERACDAEVVRLYPHLRRSYAEGLLDVAAAVSTHRPAMALGLDGPGAVRRRLRGIMGRDRHFGGRRSAGAAVVLLAVVVLPAWRGAQTAESSIDAAHSAEAAPRQEPVVGALSRATLDPEPDVRRAAANALRDIGSPAALSLLRTLVQDPDAAVRHAARSALGLERARPNLRFPESAPPAITARALDSLVVALISEDAAARLSAARRLGNVRDRRAVPALSRALLDSEFQVRQSAADALGNIGDAAAATPLTALLTDAHPRVRQSAASAVGRTGGMSAVPALAQALADADVHVRRSAASALGRIGGRGR
jgi:beta-lactamase regulating signal transducer with metallopeptidase domain